MRRRFKLEAASRALLVCVATGFCVPSVFALQPSEREALQQMEYRDPGLWWSSVYLPVMKIPSDRRFDLTTDLARLGVDLENAYFDRRTGRWGTLILTQPLIPGPGVHNDLDWSWLGRQVPGSPEELGEAAWAAFRDFLVSQEGALRFALTEFGKPAVTMHTRRLIRIHVGRQYEGIPVRDTFVTAAINSGNLVLMGQRNWGDLVLDAEPSISVGQAEDELRRHLGDLTHARLRQGPRLEIIPVSNLEDEQMITVGNGLQHRLVWVLEPVFDGDPGRWEALVDAHGGDLLAFENKHGGLSHAIDGGISPGEADDDGNQQVFEGSGQDPSRRVTGGIFPVSNDGIGADGNLQLGYPMPFADVALDGSPAGFTTTGGNAPESAAVGVLSTELSGQFVHINDACGLVDESAVEGDLDLGGAAGTDCNVPAGHSAGDTNAARTAFYELNRMAEQARGYMPGNVWLQQQLSANLNIDQNCNAFWNGSTVNFMTSGGGCANTGELATLIDQAWGQGMDDNNGNPTMSQPRQGAGDLFAQNRLVESCIGRGFRPGVNCGGSGDPCIDCTGVREVDWTMQLSGQPHDISWALANCSAGPNTPCGRNDFCESEIVSETGWDLVHRDLRGFDGSSFDLDLNTALEIGTRLTYHGTDNVFNWYQCTTDGTGGCNADSGYFGFLVADDDNGDLTDGTPHLTAIFAAFNRHQIACPTPTVQDGGCPGGPTTAPANLVATPMDESAQLSWNPVAGASEYWIFRTEGVRGCDFGKARVGITGNTSFSETGLMAGFGVLYSVVAVGASDACTGPMSACVAVTPVDADYIFADGFE